MRADEETNLPEPVPPTAPEESTPDLQLTTGVEPTELPVDTQPEGLAEAPAQVPAEPPVLAEPVADTPTEVPDAVTETVLTEVHEEDSTAELQRQQETQVQAVLSQVLDNPDTDYETLLLQANPQEIVILVEALASRPIDRATLRVVAIAKKQFDSLFAQSLGDTNTRLEQATGLGDTETAEATKLEKAALTTYSQRFSRALLQYNKKRQAWEEAQTVEREANAKQKRELLDQLREVVRSEQVQAINKVREIQKKWRDVGPVPHTEFEDINESYRALLDQYYNLRAQYNELLEQDRKYNLAEKERLIEELEAICESLEDETDTALWQEAANRVTALHDAWKHVGAIPREETESTWERFKAATDRFYELRRGFFETRDEQRAENTELKQALVAELLPFGAFAATTKEAWQQASEAVQALQERWRLIGPAKRDVGKQLFKTYRDTLNGFYKQRSTFFESLNAARGGLLAQKQALLDQAEALEALHASEDLTSLAEKYKALQREWKKTGLDDYRDARKLAKKFRKLCDTFFGKLKQSYADQHAQELDNQAKKEAILEALERLTEQPAPEGVNVAAEARRLQGEWEAIGHVPFKAKDKLYTRYRNALGKLGANAEPEHRGKREGGAPRGPKYGGGGGGGHHKGGHGQNQGPQDPDKRRIVGQLKRVEETIQQYENNILFISKGKAGDTLRAEINAKIEAARQEYQQLERELKALDAPKPE